MSDIETLPGPAEESGVTPWFPYEVKPARPGVYQRDMRSGAGVIRYAMWDGRYWYISGSTPPGAAGIVPSTITRSPVVHAPWRGLTYHAYMRRRGGHQ